MGRMVVVVVVVSVGAERWDVAAPRRNTLRARNGKAAIKPAGVYGVYASRSILLKFYSTISFQLLLRRAQFNIHS